MFYDECSDYVKTNMITKYIVMLKYHGQSRDKDM